MSREANFDGIVGPTHNYSGLAHGNLAATGNARALSNPKQAALQGLSKMRALAGLGLLQGVLPPQDRPSIRMLRSVGFSGSDGQVLSAVAEHDPQLLQAASSGASMWVANAATVSPSPDTRDGRVHFTTANLSSQLHRSLEAETTRRSLAATFPDPQHFVHHEPVPPALGDEGAANHTRFATSYGEPGTHLFVYGRSVFGGASPRRFPARQTLEASQAVVRQHGLDERQVVFAQQNPVVVDQGVFHNDVIAVGNQRTLFHHEQAFRDPAQVISKLRTLQPDLQVVTVSSDAVSLDDAVSSYLFNSQIVDVAGRTTLIAPRDIETVGNVHAIVSSLDAFDEVLTYDLRESMRNGGGPACLRLRVVLDEAEAGAVNPSSLWSDDLDATLVGWVEKHYRSELTPEDLHSLDLLEESRVALDELTNILGLGSIYDFQRSSA